MPLRRGLPWAVLGMAGLGGILAGFAVLLVALPLGAKVGITTLVNVVLVGLVIDGTLAVLPDVSPLPLRWAMLLVGVALGGLGTALYLVPGLGAGPRDGLMTALAARGPSVRLVRTGIELTALALGVLLGGTVGPGTVVWALAVGPVVQQGLVWFTALIRDRDLARVEAPPHPG